VVFGVRRKGERLEGVEGVWGLMEMRERLEERGVVFGERERE
jgi:hypothetical protein